MALPNQTIEDSAVRDNFADLDRRVLALSQADKWHAIGAAGEPSFENGWINFGVGVNAAAFRKLPSGDVQLRGLVKLGTVTATIFTLPAGYLPQAQYNIAVASNGAFGYITVNTSGTVVASGGSNTSLSLDNITISTS